ncbi:MAG: LamG domain-containing protein, partial [Candidatus Pacebacteria bacterium]|nr:LamG domain-containing protein [Candidatus Paceibacterota bacterium]
MKLARTSLRTAGVACAALVFFASFLFNANQASAAFTERINYQGKLADDTGTVVADGLYNMEFKLHTALSGGSTLWTETWSGGNKVEVTDGLFSVELGTTTALASVDFNQDLWLSINIGGTGTPSWDGEMSPRKKLTSVPSAYIAKKALELDATNATTSLLFVTGTSTSPVVVGTSSASGALYLKSTSNATKGRIYLESDATDGTGIGLKVLNSSGTGVLEVFSGSGGNHGGVFAGSFRAGASVPSVYIDDSGRLDVISTGALRFASGSNAQDGPHDVGIARDTAGLIRITDGSSGGGALKANYFFATSTTATSTFAGVLHVSGSLADTIGSKGSNGMVLQTTGSGVSWVATSSLGITGGAGGGSLQEAYDDAATIETTAATPVVITETTAAANTHDLLQLTANPATGGTFSGDALQITMDAVDANGNTGNGLAIVVDQSQVTGNPILIEDDAGVDLFKVAESGGLTVGSATARTSVDIFGELTNKGYKKSLGISGIIDVFVYDTTKDSDAGRWRLGSNTDFKSWYTEARDDAIGDVCVPASDDRCGASEFPAKAIIVSTADSVYIFDANTNSMWMKFSQNAAGYALGVDTNNNPSGIGALNGTVYVGTNGASGTGLYALDFANDRLYNYDATDRSQGDKNIANRNTAVAYATDNQTSFAIANNLVNDVHATVLSQSGSSAANNGTITGKTFVVAATDASASVISINGARTIDYGDTASDDINQVWLTSRGRLYLTNETLSQVELYTAIDADTVDQATPDDIYDEQTANQPNLAKTAPTFSTSPDALHVLERESFADAQNQLALGVVNSLPGGDVLYVGHSQGLSELHTVGIPSTAVLGWSKFYSTTGVTALMNGTPRAMFTMNDASGDITDATIRNNVLEAKGTPTYRVNGVHDFGMSFNGTSQYACSDTNNDATCDQDTDFDAGLLGFTIELWFKHSTSIAGIDTLIDHSFTTVPAASVGGYRVWMDASGLIQARIDDDATFGDEDPLSSPAGKSYADGQWHHLVFERVSTAYASPNAPMAVGIYLYIDGVRVASDNTIAATGTLTAASVPLAIGADCSVGAACATGANFWDGQIDDVY